MISQCPNVIVQKVCISMPVMLRPKGKARQIAWALLGVPENIFAARKESKRKKSTTQTLLDRDQTSYMRGGA